MELGNSSSLAADYCLVYNYSSSQGAPSSCVMPSEGSGDNGDILGLYRQDSQQSGYSHAFTYTYDGVNRLTHAVATGSPAYDMTYTYDQYGNVSRVAHTSRVLRCMRPVFHNITRCPDAAGVE